MLTSEFRVFYDGNEKAICSSTIYSSTIIKLVCTKSAIYMTANRYLKEYNITSIFIHNIIRTIKYLCVYMEKGLNYLIDITIKQKFLKM